jgi:flagellar hook-associated protein 1 FlgK
MAVGGGDVLSTALSGLLASQKVLDNISHNIANVNTPGYSRQRVELTTRPPQYYAGHYFGNGVDVAGIARSYDQFLTRDLQLNTAAAGDQQTQADLAAELDSVLGSDETALGPVLQGFFNAMDSAAADPASVSTRQQLLDEADQLTQRFQTIDTRFQQLDSAVQTRTRAGVDQINSISKAIADLNRQIVNGGGRVSQPNDFLDQRDQLVAELSGLVSVTTTVQEDGAMNVFIGTGQSLVLGAANRQLAVHAGGEEAGRISISISSGGDSSVDVTSEINGGSVGGMLAFEHGILADSQRQMDQLALGVAQEVNAQHRLGMDLNNQLGGDFFTDLGSSEVASDKDPSHKIAVTVDSPDGLQDTDYRLDISGGKYTLIRLSDNSAAASGPLSDLTGAGGHSFDELGFSVSGIIADDGSVPEPIEDGDSFFIRPGTGAARLLECAGPDAQSLALASPVRAAATLGNHGDATIGRSGVTRLDDPAKSLGPVTLTYHEATGSFTPSDASGSQLVDDSGNPIDITYDPADQSGSSLALRVLGFGDISFTVTGSPKDGDTFTLASNTGGSGDNSNAVALSNLQSQRLLAGGTATFAESYTRTVSDVASRTQGLQLSATAHAQLLTNAQDAHDSYSGVNLDEEAANLMRFQQAYQASAKIIAAASQLFDVLLNATGG